MKKSSFAGFAFGTVSTILFALGMCMALLPQWGVFLPGVTVGCAGLAVGLAGMITWRRMEHKSPVRLSKKTAGAVFLGIAGALVLGTGMCLTMVWGRMISCIVIGILGIVLLLTLFSICRGIK